MFGEKKVRRNDVAIFLAGRSEVSSLPDARQAVQEFSISFFISCHVRSFLYFVQVWFSPLIRVFKDEILAFQNFNAEIYTDNVEYYEKSKFLYFIRGSIYLWLASENSLKMEYLIFLIVSETFRSLQFNRAIHTENMEYSIVFVFFENSWIELLIYSIAANTLFKISVVISIGRANICVIRCNAKESFEI